MKVNFISCTKMLYVAEKLLEEDNYFGVPEPDIFAKQSGMTTKEILHIYDQFEHDEIIHYDDRGMEVEDDYGKMTREISFEALVIDKEKITEYIRYTKFRYRLKEEPLLSREVISFISKQIESIFSKEKLTIILHSFPKLSHSSWQFSENEYSLTDFFFRCAYAKAWTEEIQFIFASFLNPIYYDIDNRHMAIKLFDYINEIFIKNVDPDNYQKWLQSASKYITIPQEIKIEIAEKETVKTVSKKNEISTVEEKGIGYLKLYKQGKKIKIGNIKTRKFKLLKALSDPLEVAKTINIVFNQISLPKDKNDSSLADAYLSIDRQRNLIEYTVKELQKIDDLTGKIKIKYENNKRSVCLYIDS